jgi:DNA-binding NarL/FixJ family response regulator
VRHVAMPKGEPRLWMLETIREYGLEQLTAQDEEVSARDAHAAWYVQMGREAERVLKSQSHAQLQWFARLEAEHDNLRTAIAWLTRQERIEDAMELAADIMWFRWIRGHFSESRTQLESLLAHPRGQRRTAVRVRALVGAGGAALQLGDPNRSIAATTEAVSIARELQDPYCTSLALIVLGIPFMQLNDRARAKALMEESLAISREAGDRRLIAIATGNLGFMALSRGEMDEGIAGVEASIQAGRDLGDRHLMAVGLEALGRIALERGDDERAEPLIEESVRLVQELGDNRDLPLSLVALARIAQHRGDHAAALEHLEHAATVAQHTGDKESLGYARKLQGYLACLQGEYERAAHLLQESIGLFHQVAQQFSVSECLDELAALAIATGDMRQAARWLGAADGLLDVIGVSRPEGTPRVDHEQRIAAVRSALTKDVFTDAYESGNAMTLDDAVAEALAFDPISREESTSSPPATPAAARGLSPRELEVLRLMADGLTNQEIADTLFLSLRTATSHTTNILTKLGLSSRTAAVAYAIRNGLA